MHPLHRYARHVLAAALILGLCVGAAAPLLLAGAAPSSQYTQLQVVISEVAWSGTDASPDDEWIELYNPGTTPPEDIDFDADPGWRLIADDGSPDILLTGTLPAGGFFLLERASENVTSEPADMIYIGQLEDAGEKLTLRAPDGTLVDTANGDGGNWPAGDASPIGSMERYGFPIPEDSNSAWATNLGTEPGSSWGNDAANNPIHGTPRNANWAFTVAPTPTPEPATPLTIVINEVAWMGTLASSTDEWIELYNPLDGGPSINLGGWRLRAADGTPTIYLSGVIHDGGFFLLATNDTVFIDTNPDTPELTPDLVYDGQLANEGEVLRLYDPSNAIVDTANSDSGAWPAGLGAPRYQTMERRGPIPITDGFFAWITYSNPANTRTPGPPPYPEPVVYDRDSNLVKGTPGQANWAVSVTQTPTRTITPTRTRTPTRTPTRRPTATAYMSRLVLINEYLPRPGHDWNNDGAVNVYDEFIEIINVDSVDVNLEGWELDDGDDEGSEPFELPDTVIKAGQRMVFYAADTGILLSDGGDEVRLTRPNGQLADRQTYPYARSPNESRCRFPEQYLGDWHDVCFPTPGTANKLQGEVPAPVNASRPPAPACLLPDTLPPDLLIGECNAYGDGIWNAWYWDQFGWAGGEYVPQNVSEWETFVE